MRKRLIDAIKNLHEDLPLHKHYTWPIPEDSPIEIPADRKGAFKRNIYIKEHLHQALNNDPERLHAFWIIQDWGGIKNFKNNTKNHKRIAQFYHQLDKKKLTKDIHNTLPSLSKLAAFRWPEKYSIYDSRAVFSLNWLLFCHTKNPDLFPQPPARSKSLVNMQTQTIFNLSRKKFSTHGYKTAYFEYCKLIKKYSKEALGKEDPYYLEMLLFVAAPDWIPSDIKKRTVVQIEGAGN